MALNVDLSTYVRYHDDGTAHLELAVDGVDCAACIGDIENALGRLPGLARARLNYTTHRLTVEWSKGAFDPAGVIERLSCIGYRAYPFAIDDSEDIDARQARWLLRCLAVAGFAATNVMLLSISVWAGNASDITPETRDFFHWLSALIVLPAAAFAGQPFFRSAGRALRLRSVNMDVPISLGIVLALTMSVIETVRHAEHAYFDSAVMLMFFLLLGRYCDLAMRRKTRAFASNLAAFRAPVAMRLDVAGNATMVTATALAAGDVILVRPGERAPADGIVILGHSEIDDSLITGETMRRSVDPGGEIHAGSMNFDGALRVRVCAVAGSTLLDGIERLVELAINQKARYQRLADRAARLYAPIVHVTALMTAAGWLLSGASLHDSIVTAIAVLIITCPCALALAIPAVQVVAAGALFRSGVLLNSADAIERLAEVDTIVFDKTGTLTMPEPSIANISMIDPSTRLLAARLALASHHPLARAIAAATPGSTVADGAQETPGQGVRAEINGVEARLGSADFCALADDFGRVRGEDPEVSLMGFRHGEVTAIFEVRQALRADASVVIDAARALGFSIWILSGDRPDAVEHCARVLGVAQWRGAMKPAGKIAFLEELKIAGHKAVMVGDGLNDAPALAAAYASISPITGSQIAQAAADTVFLGDSLAPTFEALTISRRARAIMWQNLWLAGIYNCIAVPLAITGHVTPLIAAAAMSGSSILVTANALRARSLHSLRKASA